MPDLDRQSPEWTSEAVVKRLKESAANDRPVSVQVFVTDAVPKTEFDAKVHAIVDETRAKLGLDPETVRVGKIFPTARSFSVTSTQPEIFEALAKRDEVKALLESEQPDIFPKPTNSRIVP